ncbi:siderophore-interacting protein [Streptosporangium lutulentum]
MVDAFRAFDVQVRSLQRLSPSFIRVTFTGNDLDLFADNGFDQRIKLVLPLPGHGVKNFPRDGDWFTQWYAQPEPNPLRTYTVRAVRPDVREVDIDVVIHEGGDGPASRWIGAASPGSEAALLGPDARYEDVHGGLEFRPPADCGTVLLAGDETAVPAILTILERLPARFAGEALLEVPHEADVLPVATPSGVKVSWLPREHGEWGSRLVPAVEAAAARLIPPVRQPPSWRTWTSTPASCGRCPPRRASGPVYAWLAGEASVIKKLRRHLVSERGMDRRAVAFMGYWRMGRAETTE